MKTTLLILDNKAILLSDEQPSYGDKVLVNGDTYNNAICEYRTSPCPPPYVSNLNICQKILNYNLDLSAIQEGKTIAELVGVLDVEKAWIDYYEDWLIFNSGVVSSIHKKFFKDGFTKRSELTKEKIYTEGDMRKAIHFGFMQCMEFDSRSVDDENDFIQSLHRFECEVEMETVVTGHTGTQNVFGEQIKIYPNNTVKILKVKL